MRASHVYRCEGGPLYSRLKSAIYLSLFLTVLSLPLYKSAWAATKQPLPARYAHWLNIEVPYLITNEERQQFLELNNDQERDKFIQQFWIARDPNPNAPTNVAREEHYKRLAYANTHFGAPNVGDGWRSDRGMVYITLGPPQQRETHPESKYLRPLEIWFYQSPSSELPPHFYVVFFKPSPAEDYRIYSPYLDKPEKLVNTSDVINDEPRAIKIINDDLGPEVAHIALSLIPGEPVDLHTAYPSLQSDVLLSKIRDYRNLPGNEEILEERRALEGVSHRIILGEQFSNLTVMAARDADAHISLHYLFRFLHPEDLSLAKQSDGRYYYSLNIQADLLDANGKLIYSDNQQLSDYLTPQGLAKIQNKCFGLEGRLPAAPGRYELRLSLTNLNSKQVFRQSRMILIPGLDNPLGISQVFFAADSLPTRDASLKEPFSFSGVKLAPLGENNAVIQEGKPLRTIFQLWEAPGLPSELHGKTLELDYLIGQLGSAEKQEESQTIDRGTFDTSGNLLMGKDFRTDTLRPGNYRLVIKATDAASKATSYQSLNFTVAPANSAPADLWTVIAPSYDQPNKPGLNFYRAALCNLANHHLNNALANLKAAIQLEPSDKNNYRTLADVYRLLGDTKSAELAEKQALTGSTK